TQVEAGTPGGGFRPVGPGTAATAEGASDERFAGPDRRRDPGRARAGRALLGTVQSDEPDHRSRADGRRRPAPAPPGPDARPSSTGAQENPRPVRPGAAIPGPLSRGGRREGLPVARQSPGAPGPRQPARPPRLAQGTGAG